MSNKNKNIFKKSSLSEIREVIREAEGSVNNITVGKHLKIRWMYRGIKFQDTVAVTTSDCRAKKNEVARVKRKIKLVNQGEYDACHGARAG